MIQLIKVNYKRASSCRKTRRLNDGWEQVGGPLFFRDPRLTTQGARSLDAALGCPRIFFYYTSMNAIEAK